ncbi:nitrilase-related carbon-nitrogen hydrolase [Nesterenkonia xinjiangensis]|uniref:Putative amidohydrolase n=1 Tax=Nesterenkonia xinjiangensis TaxID=225327 RepID=A0A7Z0K9Z8_9MICC|nr:nitrilase-related carbon-nitrogen hydrolase [Nesterenkonia xinjiangensis]NYJ77765.1 putative amidohydrolase [Nesterenkonia xinjiangensis]
MRIALLQDTAVPLDINHNISLIARAAERARSAGAELLVTPELFATGYAPAMIREHVSSETVISARERLADIARQSQIALVHSLPGDGPADARPIQGTLISASGETLSAHTKVHLFGPEEKASFIPGQDAPPVVEFGGLTLGLLVCYDVEFPEMVREVARRGADVVLVPTALAGGFTGVTSTLIPARALENQLTVAYSNHSGEEAGLVFDGASVVAGPDGAVLASAGAGPELVLAEAGPAEGGRAPEESPDGPWYLQDRRPGLYRRWADA